uniref:ATP-dependent zinc metalloprotease YME1L1 n=1 Tax=Cyclopterus lumpus TaxID=8103 RepID=A0A8C2XBK6_CYCLU
MLYNTIHPHITLLLCFPFRNNWRVSLHYVKLTLYHQLADELSPFDFISVGSSSSASYKSRKHKEQASDSERHSTEPMWNLRELGLSDLGAQQLDELVNSVFPRLSPQETPLCLGGQTAWRTSHLSTHSFYSNKHGENPCSLFPGFSCGAMPMSYSRQHPMLLQSVCTELQHWPVWVPNRGFKTLKSKTRRLQSASDRAQDSEGFTPSFMKGFLTRDKGIEVDNLDSLVKKKSLPEGQQDAFKSGFAEGFLKAQALTQRTQDSFRRTRLILLVLLLVGLYGLSKTPFISVRFRTTAGLDSAVDPVQVKNVTFEHVKGVEEAKNELQEVVEFLKNPEKFTALGGKLPKGVLLIGPPGTGKTLLARAVAGEADVPFYYASGSEFDEMFVGVGASRIRNLFREAKGNAPCVIFIDELDSVGGKRIESPMHPYSRQTINQLLAEMDGFKPNEGVIIIGATNFPEALDNALIRPGRFDMQVTVPKPDVKGRTEILNWYLKKIKMDPGVRSESANIIARGTVGFSGADLENLVNQAALKAAVDGKDMVTLKELEFAKDKILMGPERRSVEIDKKNKLITAYHESGHAIVAFYTKDAMPINKATIMPRGPSLGHVSMLPEDDRWSETRSQLLAQMDVSMGGRVAEEIIFGQEYITTGASSDFDGATKIAKMMVTRFGMCQKLGVMTYTDMTAQSPETQAAVEHEVRVLLKESYERAKVLLKSHTKEHKDLADALLMYETLDAKEIKLVLEGKGLCSYAICLVYLQGQATLSTSSLCVS